MKKSWKMRFKIVAALRSSRILSQARMSYHNFSSNAFCFTKMCTWLWCLHNVGCDLHHVLLTCTLYRGNDFDPKKNTKYSQISCIYSECNFPKSHGFWIFRPVCVQSPGNKTAKTLQNVFIQKLAVENCLLWKIQNSADWKLRRFWNLIDTVCSFWFLRTY